MIFRALRFLFVLSSLIAAVVVAAQTAEPAPPPAPGATSPSTVTPSPDEIQRLFEETEQLQSRTEDALRRAEDYERRAHRAVETTTEIAQVSLGCVAIALALASLFVAGVSTWLYRQTKMVSNTYLRLKQLREELEMTWSRVKDEFDRLPEVMMDKVVRADKAPETIVEVAGTSPDPLKDFALSHLADYDNLLFVADRLGILSPSHELASRYLLMARYWRTRHEYSRSLRRAQRALEIDPESHQAKVQMAITLSSAVANSRTSGALTPTQRRHLEEALELLDESDQTRGRTSAKSVQQKAFIYDEMGNYEAAIDSYEKALTLLDEEGSPANTERLRELITYNLACSLTMAGELERAFSKLETLVGQGPHLEDAAVDPQLLPLRSGPWKSRFEQLLENGRRFRSSSTLRDFETIRARNEQSSKSKMSLRALLTRMFRRRSPPRE